MQLDLVSSQQIYVHNYIYTQKHTVACCDNGSCDFRVLSGIMSIVIRTHSKVHNAAINSIKCGSVLLTLCLVCINITESFFFFFTLPLAGEEEGNREAGESEMDVQGEKTRHTAVGPDEWDGPSKKQPLLHTAVIDVS